MKLNSTTLFNFFEALPDIRKNGFGHEWKVKYSIAEMLMCLVIGFINGNTSCFQAWHWCAVNMAYLTSLGLTLEHGLASYSTHMRLLQNIDPEIIMYEFINWMNGIIVVYGVSLAIDGKGLRGGTQKNQGGKTPYVLNVVEVNSGLNIANMPIDLKTNEITAIPEILSLIAVAGNMITIDAIGTQIDIMKLILEEEGSFLLLVKKNHPEAYANLVDYFDKLRESSKKENEAAPSIILPDDYETTDWTVEHNRDRMEYRRCSVVNIDDNPDLQSEILGAGSSLANADIEFKTIGMIESVRIPIEKDENGNDITPSLKEFLANGSRSCPHPKVGDTEDCAIQRVGVISNDELTAEKTLLIRRGHWTVEAKHHVLDVTFSEDYNPAKASKYICSLLRKIALNIVTLALLHGDIKDYNSTPVEQIHLSSDVELMKKYLFGHFPVINANA